MRIGISLFTWFFCAALAFGQNLKPAGIFSENMVLQQGLQVPVWGTGTEGSEITVTVGKAKAKATVQHGKWRAKLPSQNAGGPHVMTISDGKSKVEFRNVMIGEVWVASGQSNMEWPLRITHESQKSIAEANYPMLRIYTVPKLKANSPVADVKGTWVECSPSTVSNFSAVGYYFGRDLMKARNVAVGVIHTSWGGSPAEVWMREDLLNANPRYKKEITEPFTTAQKRYEEALAKYEQESQAARRENRQNNSRRPGQPWKPAELYNGMIAPILGYGIRGAIWYQGESNAGRAHQYRDLFADMIRNWRQDWGQGDFTFLAVQLAPFMKIKDQPGESTWAELREAQILAGKNLPKVATVSITDVGDENDIHPQKKEPVGARLALAARSIAYGEKFTWSGPSFQKAEFKDGKAIVTFDHVGKGLESRNGELKGFAIAGEDKKWVWGQAKIEGNKVVVSSPQVANPVAVRYGWADYPVVNLWNLDGLPASPFRSDDFPMTTAPK